MKGTDGIQIYARIKPCKKPYSGLRSSTSDDGVSKLAVTVPKDQSSGFVNNQRETHNFRFKHIFPEECTQSDVFDVVAKPVVDSVLDGFNGTIFAYGQTGSGKTFTITGGPERYEDRGIIPRTLSYIFDRFSKNSDRTFEAKVSYLEIYNNVGYDLLDPKHEIAKMEDLPKVELLDMGPGEVHLKNLSQTPVANEEDALEKLFVGDTNRMIAETPMNMASTRSHCVFTIYITSRVPGDAVIRRSKLHLVDLAGSERIGKTGVEGNLATEAKYINLSLHYLEQVIVALSEKSRSHIPYRNSMMTSVLRDSLGGNCKTTMIAALSVAKPNIDESISTCRFAQRVALIKNTATLNEETDPRLIISKLKAEVERLKAELALAGGGDMDDSPLEPEDMLRCRQIVKLYIEDDSDDSMVSLGDLRKIEACFKIFKELVIGRSERASGLSVAERPPSTGLRSAQHDKRAVQLEELLRQRDSQIDALKAKIKRVKSSKRSSENDKLVAPPSREQERDSSTPASQRPQSSRLSAAHERVVDDEQLAQLSPEERATEYEQFKRVYHGYPAIETTKSELRNKYAQAKSLGGFVNQCRDNINSIKRKIERSRLEVGVEQLSESVGIPQLSDADEALRNQLQSEKARYKSLLSQLKELKHEIEHMQHLMQNNKVKLQRDFDIWLLDRIQSSDNRELIQRSTRSPPQVMSISQRPDSSRHSELPPVMSPYTTGSNTVDDDISAFFRARESMKNR